MNPSMIKLGILLSVVLSCLNNRTEATVDPVNITCNGAKTFVTNSSFDANLKSLLSSLISNALTSNGFNNSIVGLQNQPNMVYGSFLCRGDVTPEECQKCVKNATRDVVKKCSNVKQSIIWNDKCSVRYSDVNFFSKLEEEPHFFSSNGEPITGENPDELFGKILDTMEEFVTQLGTLSSSKRKLATKMVALRWFPLYNYAECTPDINGVDCSNCIRKAISYLPSCCSKKIGGRVLLPSCSIRYENYPFYDDILKEARKRHASSLQIAVGVSSTFFSLAIFTLISFWLFRRKKLKKCSSRIDEIIDRKEYSNIDSMLFRLSQIKDATNNFCDANKLGQGGFGAVYKGMLPDGREIAAKRLSKCSGQGAEEFKNEIESVTKLQHRNLVRLLGICFEGEEMILVYEFVPNRSLDYFLFDSENRDQLDWPKRYKIIVGTARGLLYLHEDSRLRIIHRDLKASNVLLDNEMNPRISDFGTARIFGVNQIQGSTNRIVGTYGYMSPEYVMFGNFSVKSDVFSFGVLLLEIISSKKISTSKQEFGESLLDIAWKHWKRGTPLEFMDPNLRASCLQNEVIKGIHVGLLCVQEDMEDRPIMASVVTMLTSETTSLPLPRQPAFIISNDMNSQTSTTISSNINITITTL